MIEAPLLSRVVEFLDGISLELKIDLDRLKTEKRYFEVLYLKLINNLKELKKLKDEMEQKGFDSPYFALGMSRYDSPLGKQSYRREDVEDQRDVARHKMFFRTDASFRKGSFERTKSAIASHNIAVGHLEEFVSFDCSKCGVITKGKEATKIIEKNGTFICPKCNSEPKLRVNETGIYRMEILPYLSFGGEFTDEISRFTPTEKIGYRGLIEVLREKKRGRIKSATVVFKAVENGRWVTKKEQVEIDKGSKLDYEGVLRQKYGRIVIEHIRYHHERNILVSGRYNRQALAIAYTKILKEKGEEILDFLLEQKVDVEKLKEYERLRKKIELKMYGVLPPTFSMDARIAEERMELMEELDEELKKAGLMDKRGNLIPELEEAINYRRQIRKETLIKIPIALFAWDIFKFLLIKPYRERRYASIFPGLQPVPQRDQLEKALAILKEEYIISAIRRFIDGSVMGIDNAHDMVFKKFELEDILQDYLKVTSSRAVGGISLYLSSNMNLETSAGIVSAEVAELEEVLKVIIRLGRDDVIPPEKLEGLEEIKSIKISDKARQFLELVR
ncbi:MAG: DUF530 family protein [Euryarchaeota archaeon]|nr:DUF530 family protein [Euryarchaeota archaeon]